MAESLIPEESRALIGQLLSDPLTAMVVTADAQRYAYAAGDLNPLYFDEDFAKSQGYRSLVCPPTFVNYVIVSDKPLTELRTDGLYRAGGRSIPLRVARSMFGGEEWDFIETVYMGDTITAESRLLSLDEKDGGSGPFVLTTRQTTFTNQDGRIVARTRQVGISR